MPEHAHARIAAQGSELASIFKTAISQVSSGVRLVKLP